MSALLAPLLVLALARGPAAAPTTRSARDAAEVTEPRTETGLSPARPLTPAQPLAPTRPRVSAPPPAPAPPPATALRAAPLQLAVPPDAPGGASPEVFALIVANNRGMALGRAPLQYADDDAAKDYDIFAMLAPPEHLALLTTFDRDTERLFPHLVDRALAPTRANVAAAAKVLAPRIAQARAQGHAVELFFIYAGHGDVDEGRGFLELEDGPFKSEDLERLITTLQATHTHVVLDSCNSFFVLNPRSPGGRRFATPKDAVQGLQKKLPGVGVFLSTSAEAETFEWSELQSGIFSYAVRAGLLGAADANADGEITYEELAAFVQTSAEGIKNPAFRPHVFARGPDGDDSAVLVDWRAVHPPSVSLEGAEPVRVTLRDGDGLPWADAYKELGAKLVLRMPPSKAPHAVLEESAFQEGHRRVVARYGFPDPVPSQPLTLAQLLPQEIQTRGRGAGELFEALFTDPFGPHALAQYEEQLAHSPPAIYGVSMADVDRMHLLLGQLAQSDRNRRAIQVGWMTATAASLGVVGALNAFEPSGDHGLGYATMGLGAAVAVGTLLLPRPASGEQLSADFQRWQRELPDPAEGVARADLRLEQLYAEELHARHKQRVLGWLTVGAGAIFTVGNEFLQKNQDRISVAHLGGPLLMAVGTGVLLDASLGETPSESVLHLWRDDPNRPSVQLGGGVLPGGGMVTVGGWL